MSINDNKAVSYSAEFYYPQPYAASSDKQDIIDSALVQETISDLHTNASLIQTYIASCLTQKDIELDKIKSIKKTQQETREHARYWLDKLVPKINRIYTDVTGFCNLSDAYWEDLIAKANEIKNKNDEHANHFKTIIQELKNDLDDKIQKTTNLTSDLSGFRTFLEEDNKNFQTIIADAQRIYAGSDGEIKVTRDEIAGIKTAIEKDIGIIAGGSVAVVGGIIMIGVGAVGSIVTGGVATKLIIAGIGTTITGVAMIAVASKDLVEKQKSYGVALQKLAQLEAEMAGLQNVDDHFTGLKDNNDKSNKAVESMRQAWIVLNNNFQELENSVEKIDADKRTLLVGRMKTAQKNFDSLKLQATNMQKNSILKVEVAPELASTLRLAKTTYSFPAYSLSTKRLFNEAPWILSLPELAELTK